MTRAAWGCLALLLWAGTSRAQTDDPQEDEAGPRVRAVRFEGQAVRGRAQALRALVAGLVDGPATDARLVEAVHKLEAADTLGGIEVRLIPSPRDRTVDVVFRADGRPRRLAGLFLTTQAQGPPDKEESWYLARQVQTKDRPLRSGAGRLLHPYFLELDVETVRRHYVAQGFRDVVVRTTLDEEGDLVTATLRILAGPRYRLASVGLEGLDMDRKEVLDKLSTKVESDDTPALPWTIEADREKIRRYYCKKGFADVKVTARQNDLPDHRVDVVFKVTPGPVYQVDSLVVPGFRIPDEVKDDVRLEPGKPYCPLFIEETEDELLDYLKDHGHPDATVDADVTTLSAPPGGGPRKVRVALKVAALGQVTIERVWFDGNEVTREDIIRQLLVIQEGDIYRQSAIDTSVQNLLRSGLFKTVEVQALRGSRRSQRYLFFTLVERDPIAIDLLEQSLTFRNLDLSHWPDDFEQMARGAALQGGGQELKFYGKSNHQGVVFTDLFLHRYLLAEIALYRKTRPLDTAEEVWYGFEGGLGLKALQNRLTVLPFIQYEISDLPSRESFRSLPLQTGQIQTTAAGGQIEFDFNRRDEERIPYLGIDAAARYLYGSHYLGGDLDWQEVRTDAALNLPLGENSRGQHYVLKLTGRYAGVYPQVRDEIVAHQRIYPDIRGYLPRAIGLPFPAGDDEVIVGGNQSTVGTAEVRIPIPGLRRNAFAPFFDVATVGDPDDPLFANPHAAIGLMLYFSVFSERLEGYVFGAFPFREVEDREYAGVGIGGSF